MTGSASSSARSAWSIFTGLTAYDVQRLRNGNLAWIRTREAASVIGALRLYLDFVNLFISFLRLTGSRR